MLTAYEAVDKKILSREKWKKANPGLSWVTEYAEDEPKLFITREVLNSKAFRSLGKYAMLVYLDFLAKRTFKQISRNEKKYWIFENNGNLAFTYNEAEKKGIPRKAFRNAIDELQLKGLLDLTHQGKGSRPVKGYRGDASRFLIDDRWKEYGTDNFKPPRKPRKKDTRTDRGWTLYERNKRNKKLIIRKNRKISSVKKDTA